MSGCGSPKFDQKKDRAFFVQVNGAITPQAWLNAEYKAGTNSRQEDTVVTAAAKVVITSNLFTCH